MVCEHLRELERQLIEQGFRETFRGQAWSRSCREWVYFHGYLPQSLHGTLALAPCVEYHAHFGTHDGQESGFVCTLHHDGVMGHHPRSGVTARTFHPRGPDSGIGVEGG
jgi:hypothetical protein